MNDSDRSERTPVFQGFQKALSNVSGGGTAGANRTLVLLDGKRVVGSALGGSRGMAVDIRNFPSNLVECVLVVTGSAFAVYGSQPTG